MKAGHDHRRVKLSLNPSVLYGAFFVKKRPFFAFILRGPFPTSKRAKQPHLLLNIRH
jgi:hypothetical protein